MSVEAAAHAPVAARPRARLTGVVAILTAAKVLASASGFITGPLLARALGAAGRGDLAAIQVPFALIPAVLALGIPAFAYRQLPKGRPPSQLLGSLAIPLLIVGVIAAACSVPIADALAGGRQTVRTYLIVGFLTSPLLLLGSLLSSCLAALERWRAVAVTTIIPFAVALVGVTGLYAAGELTVGWAAGLTIAGALLSLLPAVPLLIEAGRPVFSRRLAREGTEFGFKSWLGGLAQLANLRLDQVMMITVVTPRVLGLYAVATTLSGASALATGALAQPVATRVAGGEQTLLPRAVRMALLVTAVVNVALAAATPLLLTALFGPEFRGAVTMALILLIGAVPFGAGMVLSSGLQADGAPLIPTLGEGIALLVTIAGLLALLGPLGGEGAALVSAAAYSTSFLFQLLMARRRLSVPLKEFLIPTADDVRWLRALLGGATGRLRVARGYGE